jgi:20S proteasome alpha/beta subunit
MLPMQRPHMYASGAAAAHRAPPPHAAALLLQSRPFGVAFLVAGCDEHGPVLYHTDPSGTYFRFEAWAIGAGSEGAQSLLQEKYSADMSLADAEALALSTLKQARPQQCLRCWGIDLTCAFVA